MQLFPDAYSTFFLLMVAIMNLLLFMCLIFTYQIDTELDD